MIPSHKYRQSNCLARQLKVWGDENIHTDDDDAASFRCFFSNPNQTITLATVLLSLLTILAITGKFQICEFNWLELSIDQINLEIKNNEEDIRKINQRNFFIEYTIFFFNIIFAKVGMF